MGEAAKVCRIQDLGQGKVKGLAQGTAEEGRAKNGRGGKDCCGRERVRRGP